MPPLLGPISRPDEAKGHLKATAPLRRGLYFCKDVTAISFQTPKLRSFSRAFDLTPAKARDR
jgi:hypothetical protein